MEEPNEMFDVDLRSMEIFLASKARRTAITIEEFIQTSLLNGGSRESIRKELLDDLAEGGRIFGEFRTSIKATTRGTVNRIRDSAEFSQFETITTYRWVAVLVNTCQDCIDRHEMEPMKFEEWELMGLPRTGHTVCKENCRCMLVPGEVVKIGPIYRNKN